MVIWSSTIQNNITSMLPCGHEMVIVVCSNKGFDLGSLSNLLLGHLFGNHSWVSVDTSNQSMSIGLLGATLIVVLQYQKHTIKGLQAGCLLFIRIVQCQATQYQSILLSVSHGLLQISNLGRKLKHMELYLTNRSVDVGIIQLKLFCHRHCVTDLIQHSYRFWLCVVDNRVQYIYNNIYQQATQYSKVMIMYITQYLTNNKKLALLSQLKTASNFRYRPVTYGLCGLVNLLTFTMTALRPANRPLSTSTTLPLFINRPIVATKHNMIVLISKEEEYWIISYTDS